MAALGCLCILMTACAGVRLDVPRTASTAWPHPEQTRLGEAFAPRLAKHDGQSGFHLLESGMDALSFRAGLIEAAERTIDLQYYIMHEDATTQLLVYRLLRAAARGVRVRLLIDDMNAAGKDADLAMVAGHPNIEVRVFNPFLNRSTLLVARMAEFLGNAARLNHRMHNKLWIADNAAAIVGGRNLGDEYFDAHENFNFFDLDLLATGPVVRDISRSFDEYWNSALSIPVQALVATQPDHEKIQAFESDLTARLQGFRNTAYGEALRAVHGAPRLLSPQLPLAFSQASVLFDRPEKVLAGTSASPNPIFSARTRALIEAAHSEVLVVSPYFIPTERGVAILSALARRGVRVRIFTNSLASTDVPLVHAGYARSRPRLLAAGVELYEMRPNPPTTPARSWRIGTSSSASLHAKAIVIDRRHVLIGSMNLDPRSRTQNTEVAVLLDSGIIGSRIAALFEQGVQPSEAFRLELQASEPDKLAWITEEEGKPVRYEHEPAGFWRQFFSGLFSIVMPEDLL